MLLFVLVEGARQGAIRPGMSAATPSGSRLLRLGVLGRQRFESMGMLSTFIIHLG